MAQRLRENYTKMLIDIDKRFGAGETDANYLKQMKFFSRDKIESRRTLDKCESFYALCEALEQNLMLSKDDVDYLRQMLETCCPDRRDVLQILDEYEYGVSPLRGEIHHRHHTPGQQHVFIERVPERKTRNQHHLGKEFQMVASEIGRDWRSLARALDLNEADIDFATEKHNNNLREQVIEALNLWVEKENNGVDRDDLVDALRKCQKNSLARKVENM